MNVINVNCVLLWLLQINAILHAKKSAMRVVGGQNGDPVTHQYIVRMEMQYRRRRRSVITVITEHLCTATVITPVWVLTAAHCIEGSEKYILSSFKKYNQSLVIRYGSVTPETNAKGTLSNILAVQKYPLYIPSSKLQEVESIMKHDIGLMKTPPIHLDKYGKLSAVDYKTLYGHAAVAAGYGGSGAYPKEENPASPLLRNTLQVLDVLIRKCTELDVVLPAFCLSNRCGHSNSLCGGDSGGPLLHPSGVVGVVSAGYDENCYPNMLKARSHLDEFINPVSPYIEWITNHMKQNGMT